MSEADNPDKLGISERLDSVNSTAADQAHIPSDSPDETLAPVILPAAQAKTGSPLIFLLFKCQPTGNSSAAVFSAN